VEPPHQSRRAKSRLLAQSAEHLVHVCQPASRALLAQPPMVGPEADENMQGFNEHPVLVLERYPDAVVVAANNVELAVIGGVGEEMRMVVGKPLAGLLSVSERFE
jgi:hypothetical protein